MFALGSSKPNEQTRNLVQLVTRVVDQLPNKISISGHTDAVPYRSQEGYTNWELSSDRANLARRLLIEEDLSSSRIALVQGRADTDPLLPDDPKSERNRRISIVLLRQNEAPINIEDVMPPSGLGARETEHPPARKTELQNGHAPGYGRSTRPPGIAQNTVMPALVTGIHVKRSRGTRTWMAGSSPTMTIDKGTTLDHLHEAGRVCPECHKLLTPQFCATLPNSIDSLLS